jgi:hypothetical protein
LSKTIKQRLEILAKNSEIKMINYLEKLKFDFHKVKISPFIYDIISLPAKYPESVAFYNKSENIDDLFGSFLSKNRENFMAAAEIIASPIKKEFTMFPDIIGFCNYSHHGKLPLKLVYVENMFFVEYSLRLDIGWFNA